MWQMFVFAGAAFATVGAVMLGLKSGPLALAGGSGMLVLGLILLGFGWSDARRTKE